MPRRLPKEQTGRTRRVSKFRNTSSSTFGTFIRPSPVRHGEEYEVKIEAVGSRGDGLTTINGFNIFVTGAKLGDKVKIRIIDIRGNYARAVVVNKPDESASIKA